MSLLPGYYLLKIILGHLYNVPFFYQGTFNVDKQFLGCGKRPEKGTLARKKGHLARKKGHLNHVTL